MKKVLIRQTKKADTRADGIGVDRKTLIYETNIHIGDVAEMLDRYGELLFNKGEKHDNTKLFYFDEFYKLFLEGKSGDEFKNSEWYKKHITKERHHLNSHCPEDVDLFDVLEMIADCCCAGMARSGNVYDICLDEKILKLAVQNTVNKTINMIEVKHDTQP